MSEKLLTLDNINPAVKLMQYAVRGPLMLKAAEIQKEFSSGKYERPFNELICANIGDCQALGQKPVTFIRQVLALISSPELLEDNRFPQDAKSKARSILNACQGRSIGSYTDGEGLEIIRKHVAQYIERRDQVPSNYKDVFIFSGATSGIKTILELLNEEIDGKKPGVMLPLPQFPLYSFLITEFSMYQIDYYLDESRNWSLDIKELERAIEEAKKSCTPRVIVVINPGNPTGQVLSRENIVDIIKFAYRERLFILADEVYQDNVYSKDCKFYSFKKVLVELGSPYSQMELTSFMSCSKGYMGECGIRGGYAEVINLDDQVKNMLIKSMTVVVPPVYGQAALDCIVDHPMPGDESYELYIEEKKTILKSLAERAELVAHSFNRIPGISCNPVQGSLYAFPKLEIPQEFVRQANIVGREVDEHYAFELLESTGICVVPGSGFGQKSGTYHFRITIAPQLTKMNAMMRKFTEFHLNFLERYK